ncbi:Protein FAM43B [Frankliniella fusca]|uniref:Protein FAM43B n=1 Tax=Frankliniella fusca TaxID=407009 RepID=A0AAE1LR46_9NEOP|nr:Protein FAM43B [Frankliniella fusca]
MSVPVVPLVPAVPAPGAALLPAVVPPAAHLMSLPAEAARGLRVTVGGGPQEWAQVRGAGARRPASASSTSTTTATTTAASSAPRPVPPLPPRRNSDHGDTVDFPLAPTTPESPDTHVQIFEYLKTNCRTEEYVDKIVPSLVAEPRSLKDVPELSRTLTRVPDVRDDKDILQDLGHKSVGQDGGDDHDDDEEEEPAAGVRPPRPAVVSLPVNLLRYLDESRCTTPHQQPRRASRMSMSLSQLSQRLPLPRHLRQLTVKNIKMSLNKLCRRRSVVITESDPTYKVAYLGNVLTGWAKGEY